MMVAIFQQSRQRYPWCVCRRLQFVHISSGIRMEHPSEDLCACDRLACPTHSPIKGEFPGEILPGPSYYLQDGGAQRGSRRSFRPVGRFEATRRPPPPIPGCSFSLRPRDSSRMPQKKRTYRKRRRFSLRKVKVAASMSIGALAALDVVTAAGTSSTTNTLRVMSVDCAYAISDLQAQADDSFQFGWVHSDYSAAEIEEALEATLSMDIGNLVESRERAQRLVREIGILNPTGLIASGGGGFSFRHGERVKTRLNWALAIGDTLNLWVRNASGVIYTTGTSLVANGDLWVKD